MNKPNQLELFTDQSPSVSSLKPGPKWSFISSIRSHEKTIMLVIAFLTVGILSFSFGVERGKHMVGEKSFNTIDVAVSTPVSSKPANQQVVKQPAGATGVTNIIQQQPLTTAPATTGYTIQLATYQTKSYARKEMDTLNKKGISAFVLPKGAYTILCAGKFFDKQAAKQVLVELSKKYKGCFIRRL